MVRGTGGSSSKVWRVAYWKRPKSASSVFLGAVEPSPVESGLRRKRLWSVRSVTSTKAPVSGDEAAGRT